MTPAKTGRPSKYRPEYVERARTLCEAGATDAELAAALGVTRPTIARWAKAHATFLYTIKEAKAEADRRIVEALYHRAKGYSHDAVKIFWDAKSNTEKIISYIEHYPPDPTSMIFWLKNRMPGQWRDKQDHEVTGKDGAPLQSGVLAIPVIDPREWFALARESQAALVISSRAASDALIAGAKAA